MLVVEGPEELGGNCVGEEEEEEEEIEVEVEVVEEENCLHSVDTQWETGGAWG